MITQVYRVVDGWQEEEPIISVAGLLTTEEADAFIETYRNIPQSRRNALTECRCYHALAAGSFLESGILFHTWVH